MLFFPEQRRISMKNTADSYKQCFSPKVNKSIMFQSIYQATVTSTVLFFPLFSYEIKFLLKDSGPFILPVGIFSLFLLLSFFILSFYFFKGYRKLTKKNQSQSLEPNAAPRPMVSQSVFYLQKSVIFDINSLLNCSKCIDKLM